MELKDLVGLHKLSGVDMDSSKVIEPYGSEYEDCEVVRFVLDGRTYTVIEDPNDGYRSSMKDIAVSTDPVSNSFPPVSVFALMRRDGSCEKHEVLEMYDVVTTGLVLAVGTGNTDDYYPYFVGEFNPKEMVTNKDK